MMAPFFRTLRAIFDKHRPEIRAYLSGDISRFLGTRNDRGYHIPLFVFHTVDSEIFEKQLQYLAENHYTTVDADSLYRILKGELNVKSRTIALTFDDATGSFWAVAYPLLKKYGFRAILFAIPGLVPDDDRKFPNLEDVWLNKSSANHILDREALQPLCTWNELSKMHASGLIDIQSHSLTHSRIHISSSVIDFLNPQFETYFYENINVPVSRDDSIERPKRQVQYGKPVYKYASRLSGQRRFFEDIDQGERLIQYVAKRGGKDFFRNSAWKKELEERYYKNSKQFNLNARYETDGEMRKAIHFEMMRSKQVLENRLSDKKVRHFCFPWFQGSPLSNKIARECGYNTVYYGLINNPQKNTNKNMPEVNRISEEYLLCLPGDGRLSLSYVWMKKMEKFLDKSRKG